MRMYLVGKLLLGSLAAVAILPFSPLSPAGAQIGRVSTPPKSITILGRTLLLKERKGGGMGQGAMASYISPSESADNWTLLFTVYFLPGDGDPKATALATVQNIKARKMSKQDPLATATVYESKSGQSVNVDFMVSTTKPKLLEHNVFRYFRSTGGLSSYQIARRIYGTPTNRLEVSEFIRNLPRAREAMFQELNRSDLPTWPN